MTSTSRIDYLDGLRGIAVLLVVLWHYTDEVYASLLPYGDAFASIAVIDHGWIGVNLFFLISGFVILLTLERCSHYFQFLLRRWLRLFPAMLIASALILVVSQVNGANMPHGQAQIQDVLPGLTFISVGFYNHFFSLPINELDGVYWTLYVEAGFYLIFGLLYFTLGWQRALLAFTLVWWLGLLHNQLISVFDARWLMLGLQYLQWLGVEYFGWFISGALFYKSLQLTSKMLFGLALLAGGVSAFTSGLWQPSDLVSQLYLVGCVLFFAAAHHLDPLRRLLSAKPLLFFGFISYPLYLLHNEFGIGLIGFVAAQLPLRFDVISTIIVTVFVTVLSYWVTRYWEPRCKRLLARQKSLS